MNSFSRVFPSNNGKELFYDIFAVFTYFLDHSPILFVLFMFSKSKYCFVAADVADFHAEGLCVGMDCAIPEIVSFATVDGNGAVLFDFYF